MKVGDVEIDDADFAEAFPMWASRTLITANDEKWASISARTATGFASSIIMSPAEAGVEGPVVPPNKTPDGRVGKVIQIYHRTGMELKLQVLGRISQCVLTCPTTAAFDAMPNAVKRLKIGRMVRMFGDGFEKRDTLADRKVWRIPVMEGEFIIEDKFGVRRAAAGGNILIMAENQKSGLDAAEKAVSEISKISGVIMPFPGGICRSGSKVASRRYKLRASTNDPYCPALKGITEKSIVPDGVKSVYEIVFNGMTPTLLKRATAKGIRSAATVSGVKRITAVNFGGKLGPIRINLKEALETQQES